MDLKNKEEIAKYLSDCRESRRRNDGSYNILHMDLSDGRIWSKFYASQNDWPIYEDENVISLGRVARRYYERPTQADIIRVADALMDGTIEA